MLSTLDEAFRAVEREMATPGLLYRQLGAPLRKPSPVGDIEQ